MPTNQKPGAVFTWGFGNLTGPAARRALKRAIRVADADDVRDLRTERPASGTASRTLRRIPEYQPDGADAKTVYFWAREGRRFLLIGDAVDPWAEPRHLEYLLPIAQDAARYVQMGHVFVTPIEVGHIVGSKVLDPLKTPEAAK